MNIVKRLALGVFACGLMTLGATSSLAQDTCDNGGVHTIQVRVGEDGKPILSYRGGSAEEVRVCLGDRVQWVLIGPDRRFFVDFFAGAPFGGEAKRGSADGVVHITIGGSAERGSGYDYNVEFADGGELDPRIIVE